MVEDRRGDHARLPRAEGDVGIRVQPEEVGVVDEGQRLDGLAEGVHLRPLRDLVALVEPELRVEDGGHEPRLAVRVEQPAVPVVGDLAAVLHLAHHVVDTLPVDGPLLDVHVLQVLGLGLG